LGFAIIHQTIYGLFPPSFFNPASIAPLTPTEFIQRILLPEAAVGLIMEDRGLDLENDKHMKKAVKIMRESAAYGVAMFPDEDWDMGLGDEIVRERARVRRKELNDEEKVSGERVVIDLTADSDGDEIIDISD
jgi:hypothetical protein